MVGSSYGGASPALLTGIEFPVRMVRGGMRPDRGGIRPSPS